ncbi:MAG: hypothetical protein JSS66_02910 [Armatimonadetes bacterium]|nr:hypothetical protein [Armatimonadota bacterium]
MRTKTLLREADVLLARVGRDPLAPHYSEDSFRRKIEESNRRALLLPLPYGGKEWNYLLQREWAEVIEAAQLTERQLQVLALRLEGLTFEEIGLRWGHSKQGAQNIFFQGAKKLVRAWMEYPYRGLASVFREEVRRGR